MRSQSYNRSNEDSCLYMKKCLDDSYLILVLYVNDMHIADKNKDELSKLKKILSQTFRMKKLGNANEKYILGMRITVIVIDEFICLNLSMYPKYSRGLIWKVQNLGAHHCLCM